MIDKLIIDWRLIPFQLMVGGLSGQITAVVARPVEKGRNIRPVPAPTHPPREVERIVRENPGKASNVTMENAKVCKI